MLILIISFLFIIGPSYADDIEVVNNSTIEITHVQTESIQDYMNECASAQDAKDRRQDKRDQLAAQEARVDAKLSECTANKKEISDSGASVK